MLKSYRKHERQHLETMVSQSRSTQPYFIISLTKISSHQSLFNSLLLLGFFLSLFSTTSNAQSNDVYVSNQTSIVVLNGDQQNVVYHNQLGRIASLAIDSRQSLCFWSDISPLYNGIYSANLQSFNLDYKIDLNPKPLRVLGLSVDAVHMNLYWTDEGHSTVEMYSYDTKARRTLIFTDIHSPRGIAIDVENGLLYWNDQKNEKIEKCNLDGSGRKVIVKNTVYPNHMVTFEDRLYWLSSNDKKLMSISKNGENEKVEADLKSYIRNDHIFGLTLQKTSESFIVSSLSIKGLIFNVSKSRVQTIQTNLGNLYGLATADTTTKTDVLNACDGWSSPLQLCTTLASRRVIMCQSYGGLVKIRDSCVTPRNVLLFTLLDYGYIAYVNLDDISNKPLDVGKDVQFVYKQQRVAALAFDAQSKTVYWSQVHYFGLYECQLNCTKPLYLISRSDGIGIVEGMFYLNGILAFTDYGERILENGEECAWNRIHLFDTKLKNEKRLLTILEAGKDAKLRAIYYDGRQAVYSDWGQSAKIGTVTNLKKNSIIRSGLSNPNGLVVFNNNIFFVDSHYKVNEQNEKMTKMAEFVKMGFNGTIDYEISIGSKIPFGLAVSQNYGFIMSDWKNDQILVASQKLNLQLLLRNLPSVFNIHSSDYLVTGTSSSCSSCEGLCLEGKCRCPSNRVVSFNRQCQTRRNFVLFSDLTSIKMISLDSLNEDIVTIVNGDMFTSNILAFTYNEQSKEVFYFNNGYILRVPIEGTYYAQPVYKVNHKIESMIVVRNTLYWLDSKHGFLCSLGLLQKAYHEILLDGLANPRSIRYYNGFLYWTETGVNPNIFKAAILSTPSSTVPTYTFLKSKLQKEIFSVSFENEIFWPNIINFAADSIYIDNGSPNRRQLIKCDSKGSRCQVLNTAVNTTDFHISKNSLVYVDPIDQSINALSTSHLTKISLSSNLVRPEKLFVKYDERNNNYCPSCGQGRCVNLLGVFSYCVCNEDFFYHPELKTCKEKSSYTCTYNGRSYTYSSIIKRSPCLECQCVGEEIASSMPEFENFICTYKKCPNLDCPAELIEMKPGECCKKCLCKSLRFHSCPSTYRPIQLTPFLDYIIDDYKPILKDCTGGTKALKVTRSPVDSIIKWNKDLPSSEQLFSVTFQGSINSSDFEFIKTASCSHKVQLIDVTKPVIRCPRDLTVYTYGTEVEKVEWMPVQAYDNVGIKRIASSPAYGSTFELGVTRVYYEVTDYSDLTSYCHFDVKILNVSYDDDDESPEKRSNNLKAISQNNKKFCLIPIIFNGYFHPSENNFTLICYADYDVNTEFPSSYKCKDGVFTPAFPKNIRTQACKKRKYKTLSGVLPLKLFDFCSQNIHLDYTRKHLLLRIQEQFPFLSNYKLKVSTHSCDRGTKRRKRSHGELSYEIRIGTETQELQRSITEKDLTSRLESVESNVKRQFILVVVHHKEDGITNVFDHDFDPKFFEYECYDGEIPENDTCRVCSIGSYSQDQKCLQCPENTYNPSEGASSCLPCPDNGVSRAGSYDFSHCRPEVFVPPCGHQCKLGLAIGLPVFFFVLFIVFLTVFLCCCCRRKKQRKEMNGVNGKNSQKNSHYNASDSIRHEQLEGLSERGDVYIENGKAEDYSIPA